MLGKFFVSACFAILYTYGAEVFPTDVRSTALGYQAGAAQDDARETQTSVKQHSAKHIPFDARVNMSDAFC